jgi:hypothetical protein
MQPETNTTPDNISPEIVQAISCMARIDQARRDGNIHDICKQCISFTDTISDLYDREDYTTIGQIEDAIKEI